jgi:hypothetical protein
MPSDLIDCAYCKKAVARNRYGNHLLSKAHLEEFKAENKGLVAHQERSLFDNPVKVKKTTQFLCFGCKKYYAGTSCSKQLTGHFKNKECKEAHFKFIENMSIITPVAVVSAPVNDEEVRLLKKKVKELQGEIKDTDEILNDATITSGKMVKLLDKLFGFRFDDTRQSRDIEGWTERTEILMNKGLLPLYPDLMPEE